MRLKRSWLVALGLLVVALGGALVAFDYFSRVSQPLPIPKDEATRRTAQRDRIAGDFKRIAEYFRAYCAGTKEPTSGGFWAYLNAQSDAKMISEYIKEQQYAICVPAGGTGIIGFERDTDLDSTRVVVMADGTVKKAMPEADFQAACPDRFLDRTAKPPVP